jgi:uncharacterized protein Smg (DUF494 family)
LCCYPNCTFGQKAIQHVINQGRIEVGIANTIKDASDSEKLKLGTKSRGFLLFMENMGQIDANQREMIIDQITYKSVHQEYYYLS